MRQMGRVVLSINSPIYLSDLKKKVISNVQNFLFQKPSYMNL